MITPTETHAIIMRTIEMAVKPHTTEDLYVTLANMAVELIHEMNKDETGCEIHGQMMSNGQPQACLCTLNCE